MSEQADDARISEIRARHVADGDPGDPHCVWCSGPDYPIWPCDVADLLAVIDAQRAVLDAQGRVAEQHRKRVQELSARLDALTAERDEWKAKAEQQAQLKADFRSAYQAAQQAGYDMEALRDRAEAERDALRARAERAEAALEDEVARLKLTTRSDREYAEMKQRAEAAEQCCHALREALRLARGALTTAHERAGQRDPEWFVRDVTRIEIERIGAALAAAGEGE